MPANSDTLAGLPSDDTLTNGIHDSDDFMSRNSRVLNAGHGSVLCNRIAVTDSTSLHLDSYRSGTWLRNLAFHNFKWSIRPSDLNRAHFWHIPPAAVFYESDLNPLNAALKRRLKDLA
jgi:hypothetical protein